MNLRLTVSIVLLFISFVCFGMNPDRGEVLIKMRRMPHPELLKGRLYMQGLAQLVQNTNVLEKLSGREKNLMSVRSDLGFVIAAYNKYLMDNGRHKLSRLGAECVGTGMFEACLEDDEDYLILRGLWTKLKWNRF